MHGLCRVLADERSVLGSVWAVVRENIRKDRPQLCSRCTKQGGATSSEPAECGDVCHRLGRLAPANVADVRDALHRMFHYRGVYLLERSMYVALTQPVNGVTEKALEATAGTK